MSGRSASGLFCAFVIAASCASPVTGQHGDAAAPAKGEARVVVCDLPSPSMPIVQDEDGRFAASWTYPDAPPEEAGSPAFDMRVTAFAILALLADGSTLRSGLQKDPLKRAVIWLRTQQDERGRFGLSPEPDWILDHAIGTYALCEAGRCSRYVILHDKVAEAIASLVDHLQRMRRGVDPELLLWSRMIARSATVYETELRDKLRGPDGSPWDSGASRLEAEVARLVDDAIPDVARKRAARFLLEDLAGDTADGLLRDQLAAPFVAGDMPTDLDDPLTTFYACAAIFRTGGDSWRPVERRLAEQVVKTQRNTDPVRGTWDPHGEFGALHGRNGTTAMQILVLTLYYRYCGLDVIRA